MFDFESAALAMSDRVGGPFHAANIIYRAAPATDAGGSITAPGGVTLVACKAQRDVCTEQMRAEEDFQEKDVRLIVLGVSSLDTSATITITEGPHVGSYALRSATRDPAAFGWECRGRAVAA